MTTILGTIGALVLGAAVGTVALVGVVHSQTNPQGESPVSVNSNPTVEYGSNQ